MTYAAGPMVIPPVPVPPELPNEAVPVPLSQVLRADTEHAHKTVERKLALPGSIASLSDYSRCLSRFYQLYRPLEAEFERFPDWVTIGLDLPVRALSSRLAADLKRLSIEVSSDAPRAALPPLPDFAHALGACYVIEGSALGAQFMLPQFQKVMGDQMAGADSFFRGRGEGTAAFWKSFRAALDRYGDLHPERMPDVVCGAIDTFMAIGDWMQL